MNKILKLLWLAACLWPTFVWSAEYNIIPAPEQITASKGTFTLSEQTTFYASDPEVKKVAQFFINKIKASTGYSLALTNKKSAAAISLEISKSIKGNEAYSLNVTSKSVSAKAATPKGLFYAMQSFMQLLPPQIESQQIVTGITWQAPAVSIQDKPRFEYRGAMIDACRHFAPVEMIKHEIDVLSMYKINNIHWHLTEDQGWRMEIKKYPLLTQVGAWRTDDQGKKYGGFYTQQEMKEIVQYAAERFINIVPEFEMPGHELAAIASYPWLSCRNVEITTRPTWGIEDIVMCPGKETTFQFLQDVIDEMVEIFPSPYYHIGGDESPRKEWVACPLCQKKADELGLKEEKGRSREAQLQSYIVSRMEKYLNGKGKSIIGWDEILEGGNLNKNAIVMSWRGEKGGIAAASADHRVIMTPNKNGLYVDYFQGDPLIEPFGIGGYNTLEVTYNYDPIPDSLVRAGKQDMILGTQCNLWTEFIDSPAKFDYRMFPRGLALAEIAWSKKENKEFKDFCRRLDGDASIRLKEHDVNFHIPLPEQPGGSLDFIAFTDKQTVAFKTTRPEKMVYTLDGTTPTPQSKVYTQPLEFTQTSTIKIATLLPSGFMSPVRTITVEKQALSPAQTTVSTQGGLTLRTTPGTYKYVEDLESVRFGETGKTLVNVKDIMDQTPIPSSGRNVQNYAAIAEGKIQVPEDGVYYFRANYPQVWIDGKLVVDNNHEPNRKHLGGGRSIALKAGQHLLKVYYLCHIIDGTPSWRGDHNFYWRLGDQGEFKPVTSSMLFK